MSKEKWVIAAEDYVGQENELTLKENDLILVLDDETDKDWYYGQKLDGSEG